MMLMALLVRRVWKMSVSDSAASMSHSDAASEDALNCSTVGGSHDGGWNSCSHQFAEEVKTSLSLQAQRCSCWPGRGHRDVPSQ